MAKKLKSQELTKYEKARLVGARSLQLSMDAPPLCDVPKNMIDPVKLATLEFEKNVIPLQVFRD
ncbi:MAG TPA: DNA-directed RNA polymerase subunit K [Candidatus Norongarragalinales archaeon]|nr:DNA-directed RNA polymerase subunit K [Candidatus Norongarragalinales archaeon]